MTAIQIINREKLSERKFLLENVDYKKPDNSGKLIDMKAEVYHRPDAAAVLLYNAAQQKFLFTKQFRLPTFLNNNETGYLVEACAGLIDEGETPEYTAIREAEEELGCKVTNLKRVGGVYTSAGGITEFVHLFIAPYNDNDERGDGGGLPDEGEAIQITEMTYEEARDSLREGKLNDAKTVMLLQYYFLFC
ncbi:NUDIX domain-containing protein [Mucilaginibacter sp. PAMB04168]|uniref:NUDIX domain-containing protein n=1 Tax=Mucilaginibacter sp. PAMB04168 TaxID=3138567 RepID=UPI0031F5FDD7